MIGLRPWQVAARYRMIFELLEARGLPNILYMERTCASSEFGVLPRNDCKMIDIYGNALAF